tara:strand:- start:9061 stop:10077 length:1017 start_codon:yes stop_codon:yes gene_type:complete
MNKTHSYDDVLLVPQYSDVRSRAEIDISSDLGNGVELQLPIIASPMDTISESAMGTAMASAGAAAIVHRYNDKDEQVRHLSQIRAPAIIGGAIGVSEGYLDRARALVDAGATFLCIDMAHGHHLMMKEALVKLRKVFGDSYHLMAGNVATLKGIDDLAAWGADSARCNIGGGSICSTRIQTGHGLPGLHTIFECAKTQRDIKIIADGGIKNSGDMVKALAAGADAVMVGSLLAGTTETPGEIQMDSKGARWKTYRGMASKEAQINWKGKYSSFEGVATRVPHRGPVAPILADLERGIRSGFSYSGARNLTQLQAKAIFVTQTTSGLSESGTHINVRNW